ncbi:MAG: hypothetical protein ACI3XG_09840 [Faecousia sp.]
MTIVDSIREKNPVRFDLMVELKARPVCLRFGEDIPDDVQQQILSAVDRLSIPTEDRGLPITLRLDGEGRNAIALLRADTFLYRFRVDSRGAYAGAIGWSIYLISTGKALPDCQPGGYLACICFSAQQQAAAARLLESVKRQYAASLPVERIKAIGAELLDLLAPFHQKIPLFSERPIAEAAYERMKGTVLEGSAGELAGKLFGSEAFDEVIAAFLNSLKAGTPYKDRFRDACELLKTRLYELPLMSIGDFSDNFSQMVDAISGCTAQQIMGLMREQIKVPFSDRNINAAFSNLDKAYVQNAKAQLQKSFLSEVLSTVYSEIQPEIDQARRVVKQYHRPLAEFCLIDEGCFGVGGPGRELLNWHRLAQLDAAAVHGPNTSWDTQSLNSLQLNAKNRFLAQAWLCSDRLKNLAISNFVSDAHGIISVPVQDERLVWVLYYDAARG